MKVVNPATGELIRDVPEHGEGEVEARLARAVATFTAWRKVPFADRARCMTQAADLLRDRLAEYGRLMTEEMGKPIAAAEARGREVRLGLRLLRRERRALPAPPSRSPPTPSRSCVRYDPLGPVLAIMPWNFPFWQVFRFAAPALMAGNVGLLKHAANVPGCALAIEEVFRDAGFPEGVFATLLIPSSRVARG